MEPEDWQQVTLEPEDRRQETLGPEDRQQVTLGLESSGAGMKKGSLKAKWTNTKF